MGRVVLVRDFRGASCLGATCLVSMGQKRDLTGSAVITHDVYRYRVRVPI